MLCVYLMRWLITEENSESHYFYSPEMCDKEFYLNQSLLIIGFNSTHAILLTLGMIGGYLLVAYIIAQYPSITSI